MPIPIEKLIQDQTRSLYCPSASLITPMNAVRFFLGQNFCETFTERLCKIWILDAQHHFMSITMIMEVSIAKDCSNNVGEFGRGLERKLVQTAPWMVNPANPLAYGRLG